MSKNKNAKPKANQIDVCVGRNLKSHRMVAGMSQENLAQEAGITFQQIQKYEKGTNRISASRMYSLTRILGINVSDLFMDLEKAGSAPESSLLDREAIEIISLYKKISNKQIKKSLIRLLKSYLNEK